MNDDAFEAVLRYFEKIEGARAAESTASLRALDVADQAFTVLYACDGLIGNGGFAGLFQNPSGNVAGLLPEAAARLQLPQHQQLAASALTVFGSEYPEDFDARWASWTALCDELDEELDERLGDLDERWYAADEELQRALLAHAHSRS